MLLDPRAYDVEAFQAHSTQAMMAGPQPSVGQDPFKPQTQWIDDCPWEASNTEGLIAKIKSKITEGIEGPDEPKDVPIFMPRRPRLEPRPTPLRYMTSQKWLESSVRANAHHASSANSQNLHHTIDRATFSTDDEEITRTRVLNGMYHGLMRAQRTLNRYRACEDSKSF